MFLIDSAEAGADWDGINAAIKKMLGRAEAEIVSIRKWDDRRLAYGIKGKTRGTYILCYFRADGQKINDIEKSVQLSEKILRVLVLSAEWMTAEDIDKDTPASKAEKEKEQRKGAQETPRQDKTEQLSPQQEIQAPEEAELTEETEQAKEIEQVEETKPAEETEQVLEEQAEDSQESQPKTIADD